MTNAQAKTEGAAPDSPERDAELRRRIAILKQELEAGRLHLPPQGAERLVESLKAMGLNPNGEIDLSTVDGSVRALALTLTFMRDREDLKTSIPLEDIQDAYFRLIAANFETWYKFMQENGLSPRALAYNMARSSMAPEMLKSCQGFLPMMREFWASCADAVHSHVEDASQLKAVYGGSLFPHSDTNVASRCGFYTDTIVLPDPFLRIWSLMDRAPDSELMERVFENALAVLSYRELALADVEAPIVVILPDRMFLGDDADKQLLGTISRPDVLSHLELLFGRTFADIEEASNFCTSLDDVEKVLAELKRPERLLFDKEWSGDARHRLERALSTEPASEAHPETAGWAVFMDALGRMHQANDTLRKSHQLGGTPLVDAPTSWDYFRWKLEYDASRFVGGGETDLHLVNAVLNSSKEGSHLAWLGNVPVDALIQLRKDDALPELRALLGDGVQRLANLDPSDFGATEALVEANLKLAFAEHQKKVDDLRAKKWKFGAVDIGGWLAVGGVEIAAAITGTPLYGLTALAAHQVLDVPRLKEIPSKFRELQSQDDSLRRSPVGLLFGASG